MLFQNKMNIFHMFSYKSLASGFLNLRNYIYCRLSSPWTFVTDVINYFSSSIFPNMYTTKI